MIRTVRAFGRWSDHQTVIILVLFACACSVTSVVSSSLQPQGLQPPGSSVHGILQARTLECVAMPSSMGSSWLRDWTHVSTCVGRWTLYHYFSPFLSTKHHWRACYPNRRIRFNESSNNLSLTSCRVIHSTGLTRTYSKSLHLTRIINQGMPWRAEEEHEWKGGTVGISHLFLRPLEFYG